MPSLRLGKPHRGTCCSGPWPQGAGARPCAGPAASGCPGSRRRPERPRRRSPVRRGPLLAVIAVTATPEPRRGRVVNDPYLRGASEASVRPSVRAVPTACGRASPGGSVCSGGSVPPAARARAELQRRSADPGPGPRRPRAWSPPSQAAFAHLLRRGRSRRAGGAVAACAGTGCLIGGSWRLRVWVARRSVCSGCLGGPTCD